MVAAEEDCGFREYDLVSRSTMRKLSSLSCFSRLACPGRQDQRRHSLYLTMTDVELVQLRILNPNFAELYLTLLRMEFGLLHALISHLYSITRLP
jgi:hypothetical protein